MNTLAKTETRFQASQTPEGRYRLLVESITDYAIYLLSPTGIISSWNQGAKRFKGYEEEEILGEHFSRFYTAEDRQSGLPERGLEIARTKGQFESEGWRVRKDGSRFWANVVIDAIRDDTGVLVGFAKITRDLTERKRAAEELRQSAEQFKLLVQSVVDYAIYMLDPAGRVASWNAGAERLKGYRADEVIGQHYSLFYPDEESQLGVPERNLTIAAREGRFEKEGWRVRKDGTRFWANVVIDPIRNDDGTLIGFAKITRDFTERRQTQRALEEAREALFQAQKIEAVGQLTGGVAHDFNNLLMAILGSLELVKKRIPFDPKVTPLLDNAIIAGKRGATLTQRMLVFARRQKLNPERVDIPTLVRGMNDMIQRSMGPGIRIETRFPLSLPPVLVDPNQLESALLNLTLNARDAIPEGGLIVISAYEDTMTLLSGDSAPCVRLAITDSGLGMDEETLQRAVEPFFTTKGVGKGTGLGLSMVQGLAAQSNGRLDIKSKLGEGTTIELRLPLAHKDAIQRLPEPEVETPAVSSIAVLAVDDDSLVLMNTEAMLEDLGHTVLTATSGAEAVRVLNQGAKVDLVITDQAMPNMTGLQLATLIKEEWPGLPVIIATGYAELPTGSGADLPRLGKPYLQVDLAKAIAAVVKLRENVTL